MREISAYLLPSLTVLVGKLEGAERRQLDDLAEHFAKGRRVRNTLSIVFPERFVHFVFLKVFDDRKCHLRSSGSVRNHCSAYCPRPPV